MTPSKDYVIQLFNTTQESRIEYFKNKANDIVVDSNDDYQMIQINSEFSDNDIIVFYVSPFEIEKWEDIEEFKNAIEDQGTMINFNGQINHDVMYYIINHNNLIKY